jgi:hypothetical protein
VTNTLLRPDSPVARASGPTEIRTSEGPDSRPSEPIPELSGFLADTWVFFAATPADRTGEGEWGLGFGPADIHRSRWSLFHCVDEDHFDSRSICPYVNPPDEDLHRWISSVVGSVTATLLLDSVGSCLWFYGQYFAERPDLGWQ